MMTIPAILPVLLLTVFLSFCSPDHQNGQGSNIQNGIQDAYNAADVACKTGSVNDLLLCPSEYKRVVYPPDSYPYWLRSFPLKPLNSPVMLYNGSPKNRQDVHVAILNIEVGNSDLQQCADAVMRLRAEYLFQKKAFDSIVFTFTNGTKASYAKWREGFRPKISGNNVQWYQTKSRDTTHTCFREYMNTVFMYCGTASLSKELYSVSIKDVQAGDVFIHGGFPGHAMIVMDVAIHKTSGKKIFLLAQSYMPAQDIHIVKNFNNTALSPWFEIPEGDEIETPEWVFGKGELKRF